MFAGAFFVQGKTVVITGATSGIGEVAAIRLAEKGARIVFTARDKARAEDTMTAYDDAINLIRVRYTPDLVPSEVD